jgi:CheY-like chemotaxis protein
VGIAPDLLSRVFDLFTQDDRSLARSRGGLGIGLTLVKRIVELHGGRVEARSAGLGQGSEFEIRFPSLPQAAEARSAPAAAPAPPATSLRVLVVEDNFDAGDTLSELIESWGHAAALARTGPEGLRMIETFPADVVILDIGLPGMDGYEVARRLRESGFQGRLIALSGYGRPEDTKSPSNSGFDARLIKPVDPGALVALLAAPT